MQCLVNIPTIVLDTHVFVLSFILLLLRKSTNEILISSATMTHTHTHTHICNSRIFSLACFSGYISGFIMVLDLSQTLTNHS